MSTIADLIVAKNASAIYTAGLAIATGFGAPVTSWETGDPTRAMYRWLSEEIEALEATLVGFCKSAFLDYAAADSTLYTWLCIVAEQNFGYIPRAATYANGSILLTNSQGGIYSFDPGDLTVKNNGTGKTYHNTSAGTLPAGVPGMPGFLTLTIEADEVGSASNAGVGDVDTMVTTFLGVTCANAAPVAGQDEEPASSIVAGCRAKLARMTNGGPKDAYVSVALDSALTGSTEATRARATEDSATGDVVVYVAAGSTPVSGAGVALIQAAIDTYATPLCITAGVIAATPLVVDIEYDLVLNTAWGVTQLEAENLIEVALGNWMSTIPIGGYPGLAGLTPLMVGSAVSVVSTNVIQATGYLPGDGAAIAATEVAVLGTITPGTITWVTV